MLVSLRLIDVYLASLAPVRWSEMTSVNMSEISAGPAEWLGLTGHLLHTVFHPNIIYSMTGHGLKREKAPDARHLQIWFSKSGDKNSMTFYWSTQVLRLAHIQGMGKSIPPLDIRSAKYCKHVILFSTVIVEVIKSAVKIHFC